MKFREEKKRKIKEMNVEEENGRLRLGEETGER